MKKSTKLFGLLLLFFFFTLCSGFSSPYEGEVSVFIIDAGHGGKDPGAQGFELDEKDINLEIALGVGAKLEEAGREVVYTRKDDSYLTLNERCELANSVIVHKSGYPLFVSIHVNSASSASASGFEVYVKNDDKLIKMISPEMNPMLAIKYSAYKPSALNSYKDERSKEVAESIVKEVKKTISDIKIRGIKKDDFFVLNGTWMPSVLIELGFISNERENNLLKDSSYKNKLIDAISAALLSF